MACNRDEHQKLLLPKGRKRRSFIPRFNEHRLYTCTVFIVAVRTLHEWPYIHIQNNTYDISCVKSPRVQSKQVEIERHVDTRGLHFRLGAERDRDLSKCLRGSAGLKLMQRMPSSHSRSISRALFLLSLSLSLAPISRLSSFFFRLPCMHSIATRNDLTSLRKRFNDSDRAYV